MITLFGYGISLRVERGHLILEDGIGARHKRRFARVGHGISRVIVIGSDGIVSLSALQWLADQDASFVMLDRDGSVLTTTGPVRPTDARLRRAQALAHQSGAALQIVRELIGKKVDAQEKLAREKLHNCSAAETINGFRQGIDTSKTVEMIRMFESQAAHSYWGAWRAIPINFPTRDLPRVPDHWRTFGVRVSPLTGSTRSAVNPLNAMLNYLYAVLESEARLAISALGLDPGLGVLHADSQVRDSLAFDVMEPVRPMVDAYLLDWVSRETLRREWFFEQRDGSCRLMGSFAVKLSETASTWASHVAPFAEMVARTLWSKIKKPTRQRRPATRLTQDHRRESRGISSALRSTPPPRTQSFCRNCGAQIVRGTRCSTCSIAFNTAGLIQAAKQGRIAAQSDQAQERRAETQRVHAAGKSAWQPSDLPAWLNQEFYLQRIQPRLKEVSLSVIASSLSVSIPYAVDIRSGRRVPHPRHWQTLDRIAGASPVP